MEHGIIIIDTTKNNTQRMLPMSQSLHKYCKLYIQRMDFAPSYDGYYYPTKGGGEYNSAPVCCQFKKFMRKAGISRADGSTPRVHDVRHTFSVHSLEKMVAEGRDIYCALPILSTYLGHRGIESTEKYLRMTAEAYDSVTGTMENFYQDVFPGVTRNED
jgi:integrase